MHLLASGKCLLIVDDNLPEGNLNIYLEQLSMLDNAIQHNRHKKLLHKGKLGENLVIAFDEIKRMLLLCASSKVSPLGMLRESLIKWTLLTATAASATCVCVR